MTDFNLEAFARAHGDGCAPSCPACLSRDLQAKARVTRLQDARLLEEKAAATRDAAARAALLAAADDVRAMAKTEGGR